MIQITRQRLDGSEITDAIPSGKFLNNDVPGLLAIHADGDKIIAIYNMNSVISAQVVE